MKKTFINLTSIRRKTLRTWVWRVLNTVVAVVTISNVALIGAVFAPPSASAVGESIGSVIHGTKWFDWNHNGSWDQADFPLAGWEIRLFDCNGIQIGNGCQHTDTTYTDQDGLYWLPELGGLSAGTYHVCEVVPEDWYASQQASGFDYGQLYCKEVVVDGEQSVGNVDFFNFDNIYSIHGQKWNDFNGNREWDQLEPALNGWEISLYQESQLVVQPGLENPTTTHSMSQEDGWYWFEMLRPGTYEVCESLQSGWEQTYPGTPDGCHEILIGSVETIENETKYFADFGNRQNQCVPGTSWADQVLDSDQGNLKNGSPITDANRTDPNAVLGAADFPTTGSFFSLGQNGWIIAEFEHPVMDVAGDDLSFHEATNGRNAYPLESANVEVSQNGTDWEAVGTVTSEPGGDGVEYLDFNSTGYQWIKYVRVSDTTDFGPHTSNADGYDLDAIDATYQECATGSVEGHKWHDRNGNGERDDGEEGIEGIRIQTLHGLFDFTDVNGYYRIDAIPVGTESIIEFTPDGWVNTNHNNVAFDVQISADQVTEVNFGNYQKVSISGQKFNDLNGNSQNDEEPGLADWTITLWKWNTFLGQYTEEIQTTTDSNGNYTFGDLGPGDYQVSEGSQVGWTQTFPTGNGFHSGIIPLSGEVLTGFDFGNQAVQQIVSGQPALTITKTNNAATFVNPGSTVGYTVTVSNDAAATATAVDITLTDILPDDFTYVSGSGVPAPDSSVGQTTIWSLGALAPGESIVVSYSATVSAGQLAGTFTNTATASAAVEVSEETETLLAQRFSALSSPVSINATTTVSVTATSNVTVQVPQVLGVTTTPDLTISKTVDHHVATAGSTVTYTVVVKSTGTADAFNVLVSDLLPTGFAFADGDGQTKTWTFATLVAGQEEVLTYDVLIGSNVSAGDYVNTATALADTVDPQVAQATVEVRVPRVLGLADTGVGLQDYLVFSIGLALLAFGAVGFRGYRLRRV